MTRGAEPALGAHRTPSFVWVAAVLLAIVSTIAYSNSFHTAFVLDDIPNIVNDPDIRPPLTLAKLLSNMRPVVTASLMLNYRVGELEVVSYHVFNLLAHIVCVVLFFGFARFTLLLPVFSGRYRERATLLALAAAGIFALHPVQTESVTYVIQRAEILVSIFLLAAVWIVAAAGRHGGARWGLGLVVVSILGALSKESFIVAPFLLGVYDWCLIAQGRSDRMVRRWPSYFILFSIAVLGGVWGAPAHSSGMAGFDLEEVPFWQYPLWQFGVVVYYLRLVLFPDRLCFDCGYVGAWPVWSSALGDMVAVPALTLIAIAAGSWRMRKRWPLTTFCVWGAGIILVPTSSVFPLADVYVEHRLYLSIALLALLLVVLVSDGLEVLSRRGAFPSKALRATQVLSVGLVWLTLGGVTHARNEVYRSRLELYKDAVTKAPESRRVQYNLANAYREEKKYDEAVQHYQHAIRLKPDAPRGYVNLGITYLAMGRYEDAVLTFEAARQLQQLAMIESYLARAYLYAGRPVAAIEAAQRAIALRPDDLQGHRMLADAYYAADQRGEALREYRALARVAPNDAEVRARIAALTSGS